MNRQPLKRENGDVDPWLPLRLSFSERKGRPSSNLVQTLEQEIKLDVLRCSFTRSCTSLKLGQI